MEQKLSLWNNRLNISPHNPYLLRCCSCYDLVSCLPMRATWTWKAAYRCWQGLNLRGETPMDFKSIALTTRPQKPEEDCFFNTFQDNVSTRVWDCKWMYWAKDYCNGWESTPGQLLGRQLCLPLYHHRHKTRWTEWKEGKKRIDGFPKVL